ncbi:MAG TPA: glycosyltransferase family 1 protein [Anaeromyxobacteraceae bacterium]|nr:glycosyltransferase family 1 protein [Anaeromyxobacteraceae bacterium]
MSLLAFRPGAVGGAETYVRKLLAELPGVGEAGDRFVAVMDRDLAARLDTPGWERAVVERGARRIVVDRLLEAFTPWRAVAVERVFAGVAADVVLFPQQSIFPRRTPGRCLLSVGDVQHLVLPANVPVAERAFRWAIYPWSMARADGIVAISEFTRATLTARCGVPAEKILTIPHGYEPTGSEGVQPTDRVSGPYLYYPAATFAHKDHATLIRSYATLRRRGELAQKLVFTGMQTPAWPALARLARSLGVADDVVHLGFLPYAEVRRVFAGAAAVVFPTRHEGFGIPVLEAAVEFRKKVITSRLPVFDEIGVPRERQIDFGDPEALLRALRLPGATVLERTPSTWRESARRTLEAASDLVRMGRS